VATSCCPFFRRDGAIRKIPQMIATKAAVKNMARRGSWDFFIEIEVEG
jgi:hypothetical protein